MLFGSVLLTPMALTEPFFVPTYWRPDSILNHPKLSVEDFIFCFAIGGIIAICYEFVMGSALDHYRLHRTIRYVFFQLLFLLSGGIILFVFYLILRLEFIYATYLFAITEISIFTVLRRDLLRKIIYSGIIFGTFYSTVYIVFSILFPIRFVHMWNIRDLSGIFVLGMPLEEIVWAFLIGAVAAPFYELIFSLELKKHSVDS